MNEAFDNYFQFNPVSEYLVQVEATMNQRNPGGADAGPPSFLGDAMPDEEESTEVTRITQIQIVDPSVSLNDRATLTVLSGPDTGRVFTVTGDPFIGRSADCKVRIDDTSVSRVHARIIYRAPLTWLLKDQGARNGTFVNGERVESHRLKDGDRVQLGASIRFRFNITNVEEENLQRKLYESSVRDALTGAFNRKHFNDRLAAEISYAVRHDTELSLVMFDIDHFKRVNDTYGHLAGDRVLRDLTKVMHSTVRAEDVLARYGGEEFAVIVRGIGAPGSMCLGERIRKNAENLVVQFDEVRLRVTVSIGVSSLSTIEHRTPHGLVESADGYLYAAKEAGRNRVMGPK